MKQSYLFKGVFAVLFLLTAFHLSGIESAFCDDGFVSASAESHGCQVCQLGHHSTTAQATLISHPEISGVFISFESHSLRPQEPIRFILRPPIFV